ncbi:MAG TPA: VCBS repeat-containing protein, partial [Polyangiaceae bacterium]|nr:VCBS repeat-containing protein [Polyangiaceae bacterium]
NVLMNDGKGSFTASAQRLGPPGSRGIALGDVDADGDIDVLVSLWLGAGRYAANQLYLNDGSGRFELGEIVGTDGGDIALADIDGDRDLDVVYSHLTLTASYGPFKPAAIHLNDGKGHFSPSQETLGDPAFQWFELGDLDGDRDLDAFVFHQVGSAAGNYGSVWLNQN